uniref:Uncharacterized protein n=1 Tax=Cuerna arida TaxID=1464854 RepID=A0A1B6F7A7_9HEMI
MEEVIHEPDLDSSCHYFCTESSEEIQYHYKSKFPDIYSLAPITILNLLDEENIYTELKTSVDSYINHMSQSFQANKNLGLILRGNDDAKGRSEYRNVHQNTFQNQNRDGKPGRPYTGPSSGDLSLYDSVHSIKVPLRTYKNKAKKAVQRQRKDEMTRGCHSFDTDTSRQVNGLVFERVEKPVPFPLHCKDRSYGKHIGKINGGITLSPYTKSQIRNATIVRNQ